MSVLSMRLSSGAELEVTDAVSSRPPPSITLALPPHINLARARQNLVLHTPVHTPDLAVSLFPEQRATSYQNPQDLPHSGYLHAALAMTHTTSATMSTTTNTRECADSYNETSDNSASASLYTPPWHVNKPYVRLGLDFDADSPWN
ncbi:hypothetical protein C8R45DRAFT_1105702 [Mycena sanguinolenta]|nr:hypothetical protein C8R45DRAFT_1105702 [Mycena sanguinolenta]